MPPVEICNVVSMLPMFFMTTYNIIYTQAPLVPALLFVNYSFFMVSICSMNYHIFKFLSPEDKKGSLQCFELDAISQDVAFVYISYLTPHHVYAPLVMMGLMLIYSRLNFDQHSHKSFRLICNCLFLTYILHQDSRIMFYLTLASLSYIAGNLNYLPIGQSACHLYSTAALYLLLLNPLYVTNLQQSPEILFIAYIIIVLHVIPQIYVYTTDSNAIKCINHVLGTLISTVMFLGFCYGHFRNSDLSLNHTHIGYDPVISRLLNMDLGNYIAFTIIEYKTAKPEMLVHHIITFILVSLAQYLNIHRLACLTLMLFSASTPFLCGAQFYRSVNRMLDSKIAFCVFAVVFFFFRVIGGLYILKITLIDLRDNIDTTSYITINSIMGALYIMQLMWMQKIIGIAVKALRPPHPHPTTSE